MFADVEYLNSPRPFWFARSELLADLFRAELTVVSRLLSENLELPKLFDAPEATLPQRNECFVLLAHRTIAEMTEETLLGRYEQSPSLSDVESSAFYRTLSLIPHDAPAWVLDMEKVVGMLPQRTLEALPEPLRNQGFDRNDDSAQLEVMQSLSTVEQIQTFTKGVLDKQLRRLEQRWSATLTTPIKVREPDDRKLRRKRDTQRMARDKLIAEIDEIAETPSEFIRMMDERKVKPQPTWNEWPGSWVKAYLNPRLRDLIQKDKSRAIKRARLPRTK